MNAYTFTGLLLDLLWIEYTEAAEDARRHLISGNKSAALGFAILAYKAKSRYEYALSCALLRTPV